MKIRYKHIEKLAEQTLDNYSHKSEAPIPIEKIIETLGINLRLDAELEPSVAGLSLSENGIKTISVRGEDNLCRKRFTMAHELGHLLLHTNKTLNINDGTIVHFRDSESSKGHNLYEVEANFFAATILMPQQLVLTKLAELGRGSSINDETITNLASAFEVSVQAMSIRLATFGI